MRHSSAADGTATCYVRRMHERTKDMDRLRKLAEVLRQAHSAATSASPEPRKKPDTKLKKLRRGEPKKDPA